MLAAGLIALFLIFQMNILFNQIELTKNSQLAALKLFLFSVPIFFFLGGIHSFLWIYLQEERWLFFLCALFICLCLFFLVNFLSFFSFCYLTQAHFKISPALQAAANDIKFKNKDLLTQTFILFVLSLVPWVNTEWKIIFSLMAYQLYSFRFQMKQVFGS